MHRSGTSAVARGLVALGVMMGREFGEAASDNPEGFWEEKSVVALDELVLTALDMKWYSGGAFGTDLRNPAVLASRDKAVETLRNVYGDAPLWGFKDPRACRLVPFWRDVFSALGVADHYVIVARHPLSVARSLARRDEMPPGVAHLLWLEHMVGAVVHTADKPRIVVDYDEFIASPRAQLERIAKALDLPAALSGCDDGPSLGLSRDLRHSAFSLQDLECDREIPEFVRRAYRALRDAACDRTALSDAAFVDIWDELAEALRGLQPALRALNVLPHVHFRDGEETVRGSQDFAVVHEELARKHSALMAVSQWASDLREKLERSHADANELIRLLNEKTGELAQTKEQAARLTTERNQWYLESLEKDRKMADLVRRVEELTSERARLHAELMAMSPWAAQMKQRLDAIDSSLLLGTLEKLKRLGPGWAFRAVARRGLPPVVVHYLRYARNNGMFSRLHTSLEENSRRLLIAFPIITWTFRWQRPQQVLSRLAKDGHTVIYLAMSVQAKGRRYADAYEAGADVRVSELAPHVFEAWLYSEGKFNVYTDALGGGDLDNLYLGLSALIRKLRPASISYLVQFPGWSALALKLRERFGGTLVFDCMDEHGGFATNSPHALRDEESLLARADAVIASSRLLYEKAGRHSRNVILMKNGTDFEHFSRPAPNGELDALSSRPIVGYYGAIAEWFDAELVAYCAVRRPEWNFVLIGSTFGADLTPLEKLGNVHLLGEKPYGALPGYLAYFNVCMIPFKITPLTLATNPVKFYEYLSAGKPVVSVALPELEPYREYCHIAGSAEAFLHGLEAALQEGANGEAAARRMAVARESSWDRRVDLIRPVFAGAVK